MSSFLSRLYSQQQCAYVPHTSISGEAWQMIQRGVTTSAGAAGGTTLIDTALTSGADTYNGRYWVRMLDGSANGQWKRIIDDDGSGSVTLEGNGFDAQIASGSAYELWLSPDPVVVVDSSSGETNCVDAIRAEADDFWNGYYLCPITGTHRGKIAAITDHTSSTGAMVLGASFGSALTAGDVCLIRKFVEASVAPSLTEEYVPRPYPRLNFSMGDGVVGPRGGSAQITTQIRASGTLAASASKANISEIGGMFQAAGFEEHVGTSMTTTAGGSTTSIEIATGTWERVTIGSMVIYDGNCTFVTDITDGGGGDDILTVSPPLPVAPAASDTLYASRMYRRSVSGDVYGILVEWEVDGIRTTMTGCKGNVTMQSGTVPTLQWDLQVDHWIREIEAAPYVATAGYVSQAPVMEQDMLAYLDTTKTNVNGVTATPGASVVRKPVRGSTGVGAGCGYQISGFKSGLTWRELLDSATATLPHDLRFWGRTAKSIAVVYGSHAGSFAVRSPVSRHIETPTPLDVEGGLAGVPSVFESQDAGTESDGAGTLIKVPDFSFHIP